MTMFRHYFRFGQLFVLCGPSGSGKGSVCRHVLNNMRGVVLSVSATTRPKRERERDGVDYFFLDRETFDKLAESGGFLEYEVNFNKDSYGTPQQFVLDNLSEGRDVLLEIDVKGAMKVKQAFPEAITVFLMPQSFEVLRERLARRGTESEADLELRMATAVEEYGYAKEFDYFILNEDLKKAVRDMQTVIRAARLTSKRNKNRIDSILEERLP